MLPRYRLLWSSISTSDKILAVEGEKFFRIACHLVYTWLLPWMDDDRRLPGRPGWILENILPYERFSVTEISVILEELTRVNLIRSYEVNHQKFIEIVENRDMQRVRKDRYKPSIYPPPPTPDNQNGISPQPNGSGLSADTLRNDGLTITPSSSSTSSPTGTEEPFVPVTPKGKRTRKSKKIRVTKEQGQPILDYLNTKTGKDFRWGERNQRFIGARIHEGYQLEDFLTVIDKKVEDWMDTEMEIYLRPETLFGPKFESYLHQQRLSRKTVADRHKGIKDFVEGK